MVGMSLHRRHVYTWLNQSASGKNNWNCMLDTIVIHVTKQGTRPTPCDRKPLTKNLQKNDSPNSPEYAGVL
ncbi:hypothetical protein VTN49DRAFT_2895 [Thermomyces lanuginosus]|uniref:uncharacterized protein n=1 Tax=Thermomyces lanuginosus TaxID=5541 RepID=UPI0037423E68